MFRGKRINGGTLAMAGLLALPGCSMWDTGPATVAKVTEGVSAVGITLASKMNPSEMTAGADGRVSNPEFAVRGFVGTGYYYDLNLRLIGADLGFDIDAAGTGRPELDSDLFEALQEIWTRTDITLAEKQRLILALVRTWAAPTDEAGNE